MDQIPFDQFETPATAVQGTVRSMWLTREMHRSQALDAGRVLIRLGSDPEALAEGQRTFASGKRIESRIR